MNIALKGFFVISLWLLCISAFPLDAEDPPKKLFSFSLETSLGFFYGQSEEIVYKTKDGDYMSELLWDIKPLLYTELGLAAKLQIPSWPVAFYTAFSAKIGINGRSGIMEDRDWLDTNDDFLTHYSRHDDYILDAWFIDADIGVSRLLRPGKAFNPELSAFFRLSYMKMEWISRDGYIQYGDNIPVQMGPELKPWEESWPKTDRSGSGIRYSQLWILVSPGFAASFPVSDFFTLDCSFTITPLIIVAAEDMHLLRDLEYQDRPLGGIAMEPEFRITFFPNRICSLSLKVLWRYINGSIGRSWRRSIGNGEYRLNGYSGAGFNVLDTGISFKVYF
jgi:outer membrane protease